MPPSHEAGWAHADGALKGPSWLREPGDPNDLVPLLVSLPIIGMLFKSTNVHRDETELVIVVTPRLVRPVPAYAVKVPTDRITPPNEADLFLLGRTDTGVPAGPGATGIPPASPPPPVTVPPPPSGGSAAAQPIGLEKEYGHVF